MIFEKIRFFPKEKSFKRFNPLKIKTDAEKMQFKGGGDQNGVTGKLRSVQSWDEALAGIVVVWQDTQGDQYIVDGHQRLERAKQLKKDHSGKAIKMNGYLLREDEGWTIQHARIYGALKNIAEDGASTDVIDVARIFRNDCAPELIQDYISQRNTVYADGHALAHLEDNVFKLFLDPKRRIPTDYGVQIGRILPDHPEKHGIALQFLRMTKPRAGFETTELVQSIRETTMEELERAGQADLFGEVCDIRNEPFYVRYQVKSMAVKKLNKLSRTFQGMAQHGDDLQEEGHEICAETARTNQHGADALKLIVNKAANLAGSVSDALNYAVKRYYELESQGVKNPYERVVAGFIKTLRTDDDIAQLLKPAGENQDAPNAEPELGKMSGGRAFDKNTGVARLI